MMHAHAPGRSDSWLHPLLQRNGGHEANRLELAADQAIAPMRPWKRLVSPMKLALKRQLGRS